MVKLEPSRPVFMYSTPAVLPRMSVIVVAFLASSSSPLKTVTLAGASVTSSFFKDAETTTWLSLISPLSRVRFTLLAWPPLTVTTALASSYPMNDAVTVYVPSLKPEILNDPSWLDEAPVSVPSTATLAPARALPSVPVSYTHLTLPTTPYV